MLQALSISVREGFEAALVIGIMLGYAVNSGRGYLKAPILLGASVAIGASALTALAFGLIGFDPDTPLIEGVMYAVAAVFVFSMVVWMWRTSGDLRAQIGQRLERASGHPRASALGVAVVAFFMVAREGVETVMFLAANTLDQGLVPTLLGAAAGLVLAAGLGIAVYYGAGRVDMRLFFAATSIALLLLALRFAGLAVLELGETGLFAIPAALAAGLETLDGGVLAQLVNVALVALPLGAIAWSLAKNRPARPAL